MKVKKIPDYFFHNKRHWNKMVAVLSVAVAIYTISALILPAITMEGTACQIEEHVHTEECFEKESNQICGLEENIEHIHSEECTQIEEVPVDAEELTCELEESEEHLHGPLCYGKWKLICEKEEHTHNEECTPILKLTEEQRKQVEDVIVMIDALPTYEEIEAELLKFAETEDTEGEETYYTGVLQQARTAYEAYGVLTEDQKAFVTNADKLMDLEFLWGMVTLDPENTGDASKIEELLNGDYAYISELYVKGEMGVSTGTAPFDESGGAGNDTTAGDEILRTFDVASYKVEFMTALRQEVIDQDISGYKKGRVYFEIILPVDSAQACFEVDGMLWLQSAPEIKYEIVNDTFKEKDCQVLRGSYMLLPSEGNPAAIGASQNEMTIAFRALKMHNGDTITPEVTMWLEHNNVGTEYKDGISDSIVNGKNYECQGPIVDGKEAAGLPKHGAEAETLMLDTIKITAAPRYNLKFVSSTSSQMTAAGTYDFSSGNDKALNKTAGNVYGRLTGTGIQVEIDSKEGYGMRGVELPSTDYPISFVLTLSSEYIKSNEENAGAEINAEYQPLFFSGDGNKASATSSFDGRKVNTYRGYALTVPYNTGANYNGCYNGGTWQFEAVEGKTNEVKVTITGFDIKDDVKEKNLPNCYPYTNSDSPETNKQYYNPDNLKNWWEIDQAVFTAGEIWVLQPYKNSKNVYIVDRAGLEGQFKNVIQASDFCMYSAMGETVTTQTNLDDDKATDARYLKNRGNISAYISYLKNPWSGWNDALTEGCNETDNDWAVAGQPVAIRMHTAYNGNTEEYRAVATNQLIKWDDEFFEPESAASSNITYFSNKNATRLWAAKQDGTGWNSDEEMKRATIDDLKFYTSLSAMGNAVPVGILEERRGVQTDGAHNVMLFVKGKIKENCEPNKVYMTVQNSYVWRMVDIEDAVKAYYKKDVNSVSDKEYEDYMKNVFPSAVNNTKEMLDEKGGFTKDYTQPFWRQDYWFSAGKGKVSNSSMADTGACRAAAKASYDASGHKPGNGMKFYQDSCLVVPYESTITKSVAQKEAGGSGDAKAVFDMNQNQRVIDFVLYPKIERIKGTGVSGAAQVNTIVHVTDVLPAGLTYIENSAYLGGTYTQDPTCQQEGKITGGIQEQKEAAVGRAYLQQYGITKNADGTTTIEWRFPITINANETVWTQPIRFSCRIGTPGQDATDVKDGDQLTNTVKIWSEGETVRKQCKEFGNLSECSIKIVKTGALSLSKLADQLLADLWDTMGFTMNVGNNSSAMLSNITIAETLPYNGINGSSFNGKLKVTEFSAGTEELLEHFQFYYTTEEKYKGMTSAEIKDEMQDKEFDVESGWIALELSGPSNTTFVTEDGKEFPSDVDQTKQITAIVAVGKLPANKTLKMHITFMLEGGVATDILVNTLSKDRLISSAKTSVVNRTLEGLAWKDEDGDGERDNMETPLSGVKVSLWKLNKDGIYEKVCYPKTKIPVEIETGQQVSIQASVADIKPYVGKDSTDPFVSGRYKFTELPAGTYKVMFTDGTQRIQDFIASPVNHISYENRDSDGIPHYENENNQKKLKYTKIEGIELKAAKLLDSGTGESLDHDSGFYDRGYELPSTGGIGTASFYAAGGAFVFAAVVLLITRRRMDRK